MTTAEPDKYAAIMDQFGDSPAIGDLALAVLESPDPVAMLEAMFKHAAMQALQGIPYEAIAAVKDRHGIEGAIAFQTDVITSVADAFRELIYRRMFEIAAANGYVEGNA